MGEHCCHCTPLGSEALRRLWLTGAPAPYDVWSNLIHGLYLAEWIDTLACRKLRRLPRPSRPSWLASLVPRILSPAWTQFHTTRANVKLKSGSRPLVDGKVQEALVRSLYDPGRRYTTVSSWSHYLLTWICGWMKPALDFILDLRPKYQDYSNDAANDP